MKRIATFVGVLVCTSTFTTPIFAAPNSSQKSFWQDVQDSPVQQFRRLSTDKNPLKKRSLSLDVDGFKQVLMSKNSIVSDSTFDSTSIKNRSFRSNKATTVEINLPLPKGGFVRVEAIDSPILSEELALSHPEIKTWRVVGVDNPSISGRIDFTSKGFHGMLVMEDGETIYIDPDNTKANTYNSLSKRDNAAHFNLDFNCEVHGKHSLLPDFQKLSLSGRSTSTEATVTSTTPAKMTSPKELAQIPANQLITYRLAVAATGEFTAKLGGNSIDAYASIVTTINRVNEIYQRDIGIKLQLVTDEQFVYTDAATDPYNNNSTSDMVQQNANNLSANLGVANFDIGHVFAQGSLGGLAYVGVACLDSSYIPDPNNPGQNITLNGIKGGGATGLPNPQGEIFSVDFVSHEIAHQLGANHTFNSTKNSCAGGRSDITAVEPGSGSTIMAYSGICGTDNIQFDADAMFHWKSIDQINNYTRVADPQGYTNGSDCGVRSSINSQAVANAGEDSVIPVNTPFLLKGLSANNSSYSWDQIDNGAASEVDIDVGNNAIIRSVLPSANPNRYIPRLSDLFAGTHTIGEQLPQTVRDINFAFVVRDGNGGIASDFKKVSTQASSGFRVLSQSTAQTLFTNQTINVDWNVGGTTGGAVNCSNVDIQLLRVDGSKNMLLANTSNDGTEQFTIANSTPTMTNARIMVACTNQPFFQISTGNITLAQGVDNTAPVITLIGSSSLEIIKGLSYTEAGATATDDFDSIVSVITTGSVDTTTLGTYTITYTATDAVGNTATAIRTVTVIADTVAPMITLNGSNPVSVYVGTTYADAGATATDNVDGSFAASSTGSVNTSAVGTYKITYKAIDSVGNSSTAIRTVTVIGDTVAPVIRLNGAANMTIIVGSDYADAGATATDNKDASIVVSTSGTVNNQAKGTYTITYAAVDQAGNNAIPVTRTINVIEDSVAPIITLYGNSEINVLQGSTYSDNGALAVDNIDGQISVSTQGFVDTSVVDTYTITYTAVDTSGNTATATRTVVVVAGAATDNGDKKLASDGESGGGSFGLLLLPLAMLGWRRRSFKK